MSLEVELAEHAPFLRALARGLAADPSAADDLVQDTYVAALGGGAQRATRLVPWLATVLRNRAARRIRSDGRRRAREQAAAIDPKGPDTVTVAIKLEVARRLLQHLETLDARSREVVYLRFYQDRKPQHIAAELHLPLGTVKTRLARALARLRELLDTDDPEGKRDWLPAVCAIGGIEPGAGGVAAGTAPGLPRLLTPRHALAAAIPLTMTIIAVGILRPEPSQPGLSPQRAVGTAATASGNSQPSIDAPGNRQAVDANVPFTLVQGRVEDANIGATAGSGTPAAGVVVRYRLRQPNDATATDISPNATRTVEFETTTDAKGHFRIAVPEHNELDLIEARGNGVLHDATWWRASFMPEPLLLTRYLRGALEGVVVEPCGTGVAHASVRLEHRHGRQRVAVETTTDDSGRFAFTDVITDSWLQAECYGFVPVGAMKPTPGERGGWQPSRIVIARSAALTVEFVNAAGGRARFVDGVAFAVSPAETGLLAQLTPASPSSSWTPIANGRARLIVPAELQLNLWSGGTLFVGERDGAAVPLEPGSPTGRPIVLQAGTERTLRIALGTDTEVCGTVVDPDGQPVANADVSFQQVNNGRLEPTGMATTDGRGHFELRVTGAGARQPLLVSARGSGASANLRATRCLQVGGTQPMPVELRLAAPRQLVGHVRDTAGRPVAARVRCQLDLPGMAEPVGHSGETETDDQGAFRIALDLDTTHHLEILSDDHAAMTVDGIRPGDAPIEVVLEQAKPSRIRLRTAASKPLSYVVVRVYYRQAGADIGPPWPLLGAGTTWSHQALPADCHVDGTSTANAGWRCEEHRRPAPIEGPLELLLDSGSAWISVGGHGIDGEQMSPVTTGEVTIPPGKIALQVELTTPAGRRGRVEFGEHGQPFPACVAIADDAGRLLAISVLGDEGNPARILATSSHGHFALSAPRGTWQLVVGTRAELERGEARLRRRIVFADGLTEEVVLQP